MKVIVREKVKKAIAIIEEKLKKEYSIYPDLDNNEDKIKYGETFIYDYDDIKSICNSIKEIKAFPDSKTIFEEYEYEDDELMYTIFNSPQLRNLFEEITNSELCYILNYFLKKNVSLDFESGLNNDYFYFIFRAKDLFHNEMSESDIETRI